jgi:tryptophan synthase alpha chain
MNRIEQYFTEAQAEGRKSLILFLTAGFPSLKATEEIVAKIDEAGCDVLELGVPFSDPIADGPTIQAASAEALATGTTLAKILDLVGRIRERSQVPILLFGAYNPFFHYGLEALVKRAVEVGVDGFLVPDVPIEESDEFDGLCRNADLSMIYLVAPTTPEERMRQIAKKGSGFLYYISLKGVTGTAITVGDDLREGVETLRRVAAPLPVAVGFGVQTPEHAKAVAEIADGIVVGTALIKLVDAHRDSPDLAEKAADFTRALKAAI